MNYLLDTNIIIIYSKRRDVAKRIEEEHQIFAEKNNLSISLVTKDKDFNHLDGVFLDLKFVDLASFQ